MRKHLLLTFTILMTGILPIMAEDSPKLEMRAVWFTTHWRIDWPTTVSDGTATTINKQKKEMTAILDKLVAGNMNTFCMQVRPLCDAFYKSDYAPWSRWLTGTRGKDPGWDPLAYAVEEGHKRGLELHIWINPYRYELNAGEYGNVDIRKEHPNWLLSFNNEGSFVGTILDPGLPEVRKYIQNVIGEIINNYDIDGFIADDYFYPYGGTANQDSVSQRLYKPAGMDVKDWRRSNVDQTIKMIYDTIQAVKPWIKMGMGPGGIWSTSKSVCAEYGLPYPDNLAGWESETYNSLACNTVAWIRDGYVEYVAPQIYWASTSSKHDFTNLCKWWAYVVKHYSDMRTDGKKCFSWPSAAPYRDEYDANEIDIEIDNTRKFNEPGESGIVYYNTHSYLSKMAGQVKTDRYQYKAILPPFSWKKHEELGAPTNLQLNNGKLTWNKINDQTRYTVYAYPKGMNKKIALNQSKYLLGITYTNSYDVSGVANLNNMTLAVCAYDRYDNEFAPSTYNEGEEAALYIISVTANNDDWGEVKGGGEFMDGTEITIAATAKYGYTFSEWNDGNTDNPRKVTVSQNKTYTAIFERKQKGEYVSGSISMETMWTKSTSQSGWLGTSNENRSIAYANDTLYVADGSNSKLHRINPADGALYTTVDLTEHYFGWHNLRGMNSGRLYGGNTATTSSSISIFMVNGDGTQEESVTVNLPSSNRSDYFYPYQAADGSGYLSMLNNNGNCYTYIPLDAQGKPDKTTAQTIDHSDLPSGTSAKAVPIDEGSFLASVRGRFPTRHLIATGEMIDKFENENATNPNVSGVCPFWIRGNLYMILPTSPKGGFVIYDITDGLAEAKALTNGTPALGSASNTACTVDYAIHQDKDITYVYELAPNNGIAAYKVTFTPDSLPSGNENVKRTQIHEGNVYSTDGRYMGYMNINRTSLLPIGVYIMRKDGQARKILNMH